MKNVSLETEEQIIVTTGSRFDRIIEKLPVAVYTCDAQGLITYYNQAAAVLWGRKPTLGRDRWCGSWRIYRLDGSLVPLDLCPMGLAIKASREILAEEIIIERPDGTRRFVLPHPEAILDAKGDLVGAVNTLVDITLYKQVQRALGESENRFIQLANHAPIVVWMGDEKGQLHYLSAKWTEMTGQPTDSGLGQGWLECVHPTERAEVSKQWSDAVRDHRTLQIKFRYRTKKNGYGMVRLVANPRYDSVSHLIGFIGVLDDVTQLEEGNAQKEHEIYARTEDLRWKNEQLRRSDERYHRMIEEVQDYAIILLNEKGIIENWNKGAEKIKGYNSKEIIGKSFHVFYPPADREKGLPDQLLAEAAANGRAIHEGWRIRKDGTKFWGSVVITALHDVDGQIIGYSKVTRDLTDRKISDDTLKAYAQALDDKIKELSEANSELLMARGQLADDRTRFILESMPHLVALASPQGVLTFSNQYLLEYTGLAAAQFRTIEWFDAIHPEDQPHFVSSWQNTQLAGIDLKIEFRLRRADGEYVWHLAIAKPIRGENGEISSWIVTLTNIHDKRIIEEKKDEFVGIASHELKTPLTSAKAFIELLENILENQGNLELYHYAKKANLAIDKLHDLISELLDITKIQHGKLQLKMSEFNLHDLVMETVDLMQVSSKKHGIYLSGQTGLIVRADRDRIQQVLVNLLGNAIKYSPDATRIDLSISCAEGEVIVGVKDYGIGIQANDLKNIFDRFYRVEDRSSIFQGLGIGLYISSEIIHRHAGRIWAKSTRGEGSNFFFAIPDNLI
jgi:PAS domain S-box-containing protein